MKHASFFSMQNVIELFSLYFGVNYGLLDFFVRLTQWCINVLFQFKTSIFDCKAVILGLKSADVNSWTKYNQEKKQHKNSTPALSRHTVTWIPLMKTIIIIIRQLELDIIKSFHYISPSSSSSSFSGSCILSQPSAEWPCFFWWRL